VAKKTKKQLKRELETAKLFLDLLRYVIRTRRLAPRERVNISQASTELAPILQKIRNLLEFPLKSKQDIIEFSSYSLNMIRVFSTGALRDWIVREFLESLEHADGKARQDIYNKISFHLFPKSNRENGQFAREYKQVYAQIEKILPQERGVRRVDKYYTKILNKFPKLKMGLITENYRYLKEETRYDIRTKRISSLALRILAFNYDLSPKTSSSRLTRSLKKLQN